jgi:hypothetical protein
MMQTNFEDLFFNADWIGLIGPFVLIVACTLLIKKEKSLALVCFVVEILLLAQYLPLIETTPFYVWQVFLLLFTGVIPSAFSGLKR